MSMPEFKSRKELYEYHIEEFKKYSGSASKYCIEHNLSQSKFSYYKTLGREQKTKVFAPVNVKPTKMPQSQALAKAKKIDPEWLAEFIHRLLLK